MSCDFQLLSGKLITFEGIEGVGKTTQVNKLSALLDQHKVNVKVTREPGGTQIAENIRKILLTTGNEPIIPTAELLLLFAARVQHIEQVIKPALAQGSCVICDRFVDASFAYQGGGRGIDKDFITMLTKYTLCPVPDITFLLHLPVEIGLQRAERGQGYKDRIEQETIDFFERVQKAYFALANVSQRFKLIDAQPSSDIVYASIVDKLCTHIYR